MELLTTLYSNMKKFVKDMNEQVEKLTKCLETDIMRKDSYIDGRRHEMMNLVWIRYLTTSVDEDRSEEEDYIMIQDMKYMQIDHFKMSIPFRKRY